MSGPGASSSCGFSGGRLFALSYVSICILHYACARHTAISIVQWTKRPQRGFSVDTGVGVEESRGDAVVSYAPCVSGSLTSRGGEMLAPGRSQPGFFHTATYGVRWGP